jgi:hypothetical protein
MNVQIADFINLKTIDRIINNRDGSKKNFIDHLNTCKLKDTSVLNYNIESRYTDENGLYITLVNPLNAENVAHATFHNKNGYGGSLCHIVSDLKSFNSNLGDFKFKPKRDANINESLELDFTSRLYHVHDTAGRVYDTEYDVSGLHESIINSMKDLAQCGIQYLKQSETKLEKLEMLKIEQTILDIEYEYLKNKQIELENELKQVATDYKASNDSYNKKKPLLDEMEKLATELSKNAKTDAEKIKAEKNIQYAISSKVSIEAQYTALQNKLKEAKKNFLEGQQKLFEILSKKTVNKQNITGEIISTNKRKFDTTGGSMNNIYFNKYLKYKYKYLELKKYN